MRHRAIPRRAEGEKDGEGEVGNAAMTKGRGMQATYFAKDVGVYISENVQIHAALQSASV